MTEYRPIINTSQYSSDTDLFFIKSTKNNVKCLDVLDENYVKVGEYDERMNSYGKDTYEKSDIKGFMKIASALSDINLTGNVMIIDAEINYAKLKALNDTKDRDAFVAFMRKFIEKNE